MDERGQHDLGQPKLCIACHKFKLLFKYKKTHFLFFVLSYKPFELLSHPGPPWSWPARLFTFINHTFCPQFIRPWVQDTECLPEFTAWSQIWGLVYYIQHLVISNRDIMRVYCIVNHLKTINVYLTIEHGMHSCYDVLRVEIFARANLPLAQIPAPTWRGTRNTRHPPQIYQASSIACPIPPGPPQPTRTGSGPAAARSQGWIVRWCAFITR